VRGQLLTAWNQYAYDLSAEDGGAALNRRRDQMTSLYRSLTPEGVDAA